MSTRVTEWFTIGKDGNPALPGWYECGYWPGDPDTKMRRWDGKHWWLKCGVMAGFGLSAHHRWRGLAAEPSATAPLTRCAASRDDECGHVHCPQLRDGEPAKSSRHCPLDVRKDDE